MQLIALDEKGKTTLAKEAKRGLNYCCPHCQNLLRVRRGFYRTAHFYHLRFDACLHEAKSEEHLQTQLFIHNLLPKEEGAIEKSFPQIGRIADVAWEKRKIIFEVQCSPISPQECKRRIEDYGKVGFEVVFILHEKRFNKGKLSQAESYLRQRPCYFTNMDKKGRGIIYDQMEIFSHQIRRYKGPPYAIKIDKPIYPPNTPFTQNLPIHLLKRFKNTLYYFENDLFDQLQSGKLSLPPLPFNKKMINRARKEKSFKERYHTFLDRIIQKWC